MSDTMPCTRCGTTLPADALACPSCKMLVHAELLGQLAGEAQQAEAAGDLSGALAAWRRVLELLPPTTRQAEELRQRVGALSQRLDEGAPEEASGGSRWGMPSAGTIGGVGAVLLALVTKGKFLIVFALTKAKLLLAGLTKVPTLLSMFVSIGAYTLLWGWKFAAGFVLSIYVHEIGHVAALRRYGIAATAPMFIPGFGALVRLKQYPATLREDATVGLAGPVWGLGAAVACAAASVALDSPLMAAVAQVGAWVNLFNLMPIWQLDGGRGFRALSRSDRLVATGSILAGWAICEDALLFLVALAALYRTFGEPGAPTSDQRILWTYCGLVIALSLMVAWGSGAAIVPG